MRITRLALDRFRSWAQCVIDFEPGITILRGANGLGKTNLVESVEVIATGASHRTSSLQPLIQLGEHSAVIRVNTAEDENSTGSDAVEHAYEVTITARGANRGRIDGGASRYMRDIVGLIPCVVFAPEDQRLVSSDPSSRRVLMNQAGALLYRDYTALTQQCTHIAKQRAALLKQIGHRAETATYADTDVVLSGLETWTGQFIESGIALTRSRAALVERLREPFSKIYEDLAGTGQRASLTYAPSFQEVLVCAQPEAALSQHFQRLYAGEVARGQNLIGPQRDDLIITLNGMPAREFASNGEMWTLALALKMALYELVNEERGTKPVVILDDVFAQLDDSRRRQIMEFALRPDQVVITAASSGDIPQMAGTVETSRIHEIDIAQLQQHQHAMFDPESMARQFLDAMNDASHAGNDEL